ncbi:putative FAD-linked oxidoreductase [Providencia sneebia DSM 19967]|uniref:Putative FAD-linked oxidoreductase n=1 Tax=Providencia sneebia DSM 19967 TaxID=1141660 RepID=K8W9S8_9GAMM|nr:putative FAD-linked oxidoreductase [Providencia sneebia DSM 19967]
MLPFSPNGKAQHIKGFLSRFAKTAKKTADFLNRVAKLELPMVGVDPALVLCYRDEYREILAPSQCKFTVQLAHEWLVTLPELPPVQDSQSEPWYFFGHCTETTALPNSGAQWASLFKRYGHQLKNISVGCCGMAGTYGHESANIKNSKGIYNLSWKPAIDNLPKDRCLSTGYSCRSQVKRMENIQIKHPIQALLEIVR